MRALVIDDEMIAREYICDILREYPDVDIIGVCSNGYDAVKAIQEKKPDVVFLDIQLPGLNGFEVLKALKSTPLPRVIFIADRESYAVRAFEVDAADYLLKPFDRQRFEKALMKVKREVMLEQSSRLPELINTLLRDYELRQRDHALLPIKTENEYLFLRSSEIDRIESSGNYAFIYVGNQTYKVKERISTLELRLNPSRFLRIHRSSIINVERIRQLKPWFHGDYHIVMEDGTQLTLTRRHRHKLREMLGFIFPAEKTVS